MIATARNVTKGKAAVKDINKSAQEGGTALFMQLDLASFASIKNFADDFKEKYNSLDILILNGGVMMSPYGTTADGFETQFGTNHLGHFLLVKLLMPMIQDSACRVVHVSSTAHWGSYFPHGIRFDRLDNSDGYDPM